MNNKASDDEQALDVKIRPVAQWWDQKWSQEAANRVSRLMHVYSEAIDATYRLNKFNIVQLGEGPIGHSWIEAASSLAVDLISVLGLLALSTVHLPLWAIALVTASWVLILDRIARPDMFAKWVVKPIVRHIYPQHYELWASNIIVLEKLVHDEVIRHIRINLDRIGGYLKNGLSIIQYPNQPEQVQQQKDISKVLEQALSKIKTVKENTTRFAPPAASPWSKLLGKVPFERLVPYVPPLFLLWLNLAGGIGLCFAWVIAYNLLACMGLMFYDSALRKEILFEYHTIRVSDNVMLTDVPISTKEHEIYEHLKISHPSVEPWAFSVWPKMHYLLTITMVIITFIFWRNRSLPNLSEQVVVGIFGLDLVAYQIWFLVRSFR